MTMIINQPEFLFGSETTPESYPSWALDRAHLDWAFGPVMAEIFQIWFDNKCRQYMAIPQNFMDYHHFPPSFSSDV
jgi:hypothetical protein